MEMTSIARVTFMALATGAACSPEDRSLDSGGSDAAESTPACAGSGAVRNGAAGPTLDLAPETACGGKRGNATSGAASYDPYNPGCGRCARDDGDGPVTLAADQLSPASVTADATYVYWTNTGTHGDDGTLMRVPIEGGELTLLATGQAGPAGIAVDATYVYWTNSFSGTVMKMPLRGPGAPITLATGQSRPSAIVVDEKHIYWTNCGTCRDDGEVMKASLDGSSLTALATGQSEPTGIAVDATSVYWTNYATEGTVTRVPIEGGEKQILARGQGTPLGIAVDATSVYWANADGTVMKAPIRGGEPTTLASGQPVPWQVAVDEKNVYWTAMGNSGDDGAIMVVPLEGGTPTALVGRQNAPCGIAVDGANVYWTNSTTPGMIRKIAKDGSSCGAAPASA
jgi:sugar lactone lactonase YvrE